LGAVFGSAFFGVLFGVFMIGGGTPISCAAASAENIQNKARQLRTTANGTFPALTENPDLFVLAIPESIIPLEILLYQS
jgi:hypothetical protein